MKKQTPSTSATPDLKLVKRAKRDTTILPNGLEYLEAAAARGLGQVAAAALLGIPRTTLQRVMERQPEAREAWDRGCARCEDELVGILMKQAREGSVAAAIFFLKNRAGFSDNGPRDTGPRETHVKITLPAAMSREQWVAHRALLTSGSEVPPKPK